MKPSTNLYRRWSYGLKSKDLIYRSKNHGGLRSPRWCCGYVDSLRTTAYSFFFFFFSIAPPRRFLCCSIPLDDWWGRHLIEESFLSLLVYGSLGSVLVWGRFASKKLCDNWFWTLNRRRRLTRRRSASSSRGERPYTVGRDTGLLVSKHCCGILKEQ